MGEAPGRRARGGDGLPLAADFFGGAAQLGEIDLARPHQRNVARAVAVVEVSAHLIDAQSADAGGGAQHAAPQRMLAEERRPAFVVGPERRLVFVHLDFFQDHLLFGGEIGFAQRRPQDVGQQLDGTFLIFRQHGGVVHRVLFVGEGVVMGAHFVELAIHVVGAARGRALEHHVFQKMAHAGDGVGFIARPGVDEETQRRGIRAGVALGDDLQAVIERGGFKFHRGTHLAPHPSSHAADFTCERVGPSVTTVKSRGGFSARYSLIPATVSASTRRPNSSSVRAWPK